MPRIRLLRVGWGHGVFFVFQAEDGIRDYKVTGVQTCALPIYFAQSSYTFRPVLVYISPSPRIHFAQSSYTFRPVLVYISPSPRRSEERRVGKESRSRWSPYH